MCKECKNKKPYYITTAITYTSGRPHIGNTYEIILTDAIKPSGVDWAIKSGSLTKLGIFTFGSMVKNQMIATPQKKNMNPF